jgi:RHH-type transcriptional regulator, rel operon repressor / antitoxin RelB
MLRSRDVARRDDSMADRPAATVTVRPDLVAELDRLAQATGRSRSDLAEQALADYLDVQRWQIEGIERAIREADAGEPGVAHAEVVAWVRSWDTESELPPPIRD